MALANLTDPCKQEYCDRHGYQFFRGQDKDFVYWSDPYTAYMNFNKFHYVMTVFKENPEIEWALFCESDAMITNHTIKIEDRIDNNYHFMITVDRLNINAGNFLIRNSEQGRGYFQYLLDRAEEYKDHIWGEQQAIIDSVDKFQDIIKILPQKYMNSYEPQIYDYCDTRVDILGEWTVWEPTDWIVHWPGIREEVRIERAKVINNLITK
jgi:hypothetical protein